MLGGLVLFIGCLVLVSAYRVVFDSKNLIDNQRAIARQEKHALKSHLKVLQYCQSQFQASDQNWRQVSNHLNERKKISLK